LGRAFSAGGRTTAGAAGDGILAVGGIEISGGGRVAIAACVLWLTPTLACRPPQGGGNDVGPLLADQDAGNAGPPSPFPLRAGWPPRGRVGVAKSSSRPAP